MASKLSICKACGKEVAKGAKACPNCGKDTRNFFGKHKVISVILILFIFAVIGGTLGSGNDSDSASADNNQSSTESTKQEEVAVTEPKAEPVAVTVDELISALDDNALSAEKTYNGLYVEMTGTLSNIDSDGSYFSLSPLYDEYSFSSVLCSITDEHLDAVMNFTNGQEVTVIGTISSVGEVMGYSLDVETIK